MQAPDLRGHTLLIVEDFEVNRLTMLALLRETNARLEEAVNGVEAVDMFAASPEGYYSFIFMDLLMPEMSGHDATCAIRSMERADALRVPIVAVSSCTSLGDVEASLAAGMDRHLAKPVSKDALFSVLIGRLL